MVQRREKFIIGFHFSNENGLVIGQCKKAFALYPGSAQNDVFECVKNLGFIKFVFDHIFIFSKKML